MFSMRGLFWPKLVYFNYERKNQIWLEPAWAQCLFLVHLAVITRVMFYRLNLTLGFSFFFLSLSLTRRVWADILKRVYYINTIIFCHSLSGGIDIRLIRENLQLNIDPCIYILKFKDTFNFFNKVFFKNLEYSTQLGFIGISTKLGDSWGWAMPPSFGVLSASNSVWISNMPIKVFKLAKLYSNKITFPKHILTNQR